MKTNSVLSTMMISAMLLLVVGIYLLLSSPSLVPLHGNLHLLKSKDVAGLILAASCFGLMLIATLVNTLRK
jgi:hypothetical protein